MIDDKKSTDPFGAMDAEFKRLRGLRNRAILPAGVVRSPPDFLKSGVDASGCEATPESGMPSIALSRAFSLNSPFKCAKKEGVKILGTLLVCKFNVQKG
jgi:hypothetical protein